MVQLGFEGGRHRARGGNMTSEIVEPRRAESGGGDK